jgi:peptide/nickel transport system substrate-binding protein
VGAPIGNDVTSDLAVRRAINLGIDREALVDGVLEGYGSPATGPVDGLPWYEPASAIDDADTDGAEQLLEEAGWVDTDGDGVREKDGVRAAFSLLYLAEDTLRQGLALAVVDMVAPLGIEITAKGESWDVIHQRMHADAVLFGWGSLDPTEMYNLYSSSQAGVELWNPGFYADPEVDAHLEAAMTTTDQAVAEEEWRAAQHDGRGNGFGPADDAAWAWLVNLDHTYFVDECLDVGTPPLEPHGHGWPITSGITGWRWTC